MENKRYIRFISLFIMALVSFGVVFSSCSASYRIKKSEHKHSSYKQVRAKQPKWNSTTSLYTTYYIKKQKQPKRFNP